VKQLSLNILAAALIIFGVLGLAGINPALSYIIADSQPPEILQCNLYGTADAMMEYSAWPALSTSPSRGMNVNHFLYMIFWDSQSDIGEVWLKVESSIYGDWFKSWPYPIEDGWIMIYGPSYGLPVNNEETRSIPLNGDGNIRFIEGTPHYADYYPSKEGFEFIVKMDFENDANVPAVQEGEIVQVHVKVKDTPGNTLTHTYYLFRGQPEGYFTVNGMRVDDPTQSFTVQSHTINFGFKATKNPGEIGNVWIEVFRLTDENGNLYTTRDYAGDVVPAPIDLGSHQLTQQTGDTWQLDYTLPADGKYEVRGYFDSLVTGKSYQALSLQASFGSDSASLPTPEQGTPWRSLLASAACIGLGVAVAIFARRG